MAEIGRPPWIEDVLAFSVLAQFCLSMIFPRITDEFSVWYVTISSFDYPV